MSRKKKAVAGDTAAIAEPARGAAALWWAGLVCGGLMVLAPGSAILVVSLLLPGGLISLLPNRHGGGRTLQAALLFGMAASVHPLHLLWQGDTTPTTAIALLHQPMVLSTAWIALLAGWLVSEFASAVLRVHADVVAAGQRRRMMEQVAAIEEEWGPMPASAPLPPL